MNETNIKTVEEKAHPFELAGLGLGPFKFAGLFSLPSASLAEHNPDAYNNALRETAHIKVGRGTCALCGMAIVNICAVLSADGKIFGVGTDCIEKLGEPSLGQPVKVALARARSARAYAKREAARIARQAAWAAAPSAKSTSGESNAQYDARIHREGLERAAKLRADRSAQFSDCIPQLLGGSEFFKSLGNQLLFGRLSERQAQFAVNYVLGSCTAKKEAAWNSLFERMITA